MDDFIEQVANNTANRETTQRRAILVHTCSEEHSATTDSGRANLYFATDNLLIQQAEFKFKLIFNDGIVGGGTWDGAKGINLYPNLSTWVQRWPLGSEIDTDGAHGCQCYDYASAFWWAQVNRALVTGPNHLASECWTVSKEVNAGSAFDLITSWGELQPGDWVVWDSPSTGHIGMVRSIEHDGVRIWSQNYQDSSELGSPLSEDIIGANTGSLSFLGAFRYKKWHE